MRDRFTHKEFEKNKSTFAPLPVRWAYDGTLRDIWSAGAAGGAGAISLLPILAKLAQGSKCLSWFSGEELCRLCGLSRSCFEAGRRRLEALGLATATAGTTPYGVRALRWDCSGLRVGRVDGRFGEECFYFPMGLIYGGNWQFMGAAERLVFLGIGLEARIPPDVMLAKIVAERLDYAAEEFFESFDEAPRIASTLSRARIAAITGLSGKSVQRVTNRWKPASLWEGVEEDANIVYRPCWLLPTCEGSPVYLLRTPDHLPWKELLAKTHRHSYWDAAVTSARL